MDEDLRLPKLNVAGSIHFTRFEAPGGDRPPVGPSTDTKVARKPLVHQQSPSAVPASANVSTRGNVTDLQFSQTNATYRR